jgi:CPA2 family monovalent cation:H+ antiporter-2
MGNSLNVIGAQLYPVIVSVAAINALLRPYLVGNSDKLAGAVSSLMPGSLHAALRLYSDWLSRMRRDRKHSIAFNLVRSLVWQLILNAALIAGLYMGATVVALNFDFHILPARFGGMKTFCWIAATLVSLPAYLATIRKMHALGLMIAEIGVPVSVAGSRANVIRSIITYVVLMGGIAGLVVLITLMSSALLPPMQILIVLVVIITICVWFFRRVLNKWYSRAKFDLLETLAHPPPKESVAARVIPSFLRDADIRAVVIPAGGPATGKLIRELQLRAQTGASIVAIERAGKSLINPGPDEELQAGDTALLLGSPEQLNLAEKSLGGNV